MRRKPSKIAAAAPAFRTLALCAAVYMLPHPAAAQMPTAGGSWLVTKNQNCRIFAPYYNGVESSGSATWSGSCNDGLTSGQGTMRVTVPGGAEEIYEGPMVAGMGDGIGTLKAGEIIFKGQFKSGVLNGAGELSKSGGENYAGDFKNGFMDGRGVLTGPNGGRWEGTFKAAVFDGENNIEVLLDGSRYQGAVKNGNREGHGVMIYPNGNRYDGEWHDNWPSGHGVLTLAGGDRYDGEWLNGKRNGHGVVTTTNGTRFDGEFQNGVPEGQGTLTTPAGKIYSGIWHHGCFNDGKQRTWMMVKPADCAKD